MSSDEELVIDENDDDIERDKESDSSSGSDSDTWSVSDLRTKFDEGEDEDDDEPKVGDEEFKKIIGELLPPQEEEKVEITESDIISPFGIIRNVLHEVVIVIEGRSEAPLSVSSVVCTESRIFLGKIDDVFGPVDHPFYMVRLVSSLEDFIPSCIGQSVFFVEKCGNRVQDSFLREIRRVRGSDASWVDDREPPAECLDYSDDEEERKAKRRMKKRRTKGANRNVKAEKSEDSFEEFLYNPINRSAPPASLVVKKEEESTATTGRKFYLPHADTDKLSTSNYFIAAHRK